MISFMFDVEYLCKLSPVNHGNGAKRFLELCKDIRNEIHPHYDQVFQRLDCFLFEDIHEQ